MTTGHTGALSAPPPRIRVIVAHADAPTRRAIRDSLSVAADFVVTAEARDGVEVLELARFYRPEIVLIDAELPGRDLLATAAAIAAATSSAIIVMAADRDDALTGLPALRAGARGVVAVPADLGQLPDTLRSVVAGGAALSPALAMHLIEQVRAIPASSGMRPVKSVLTGREWEVLDLLCTGASTRDMASVLFLTEDTVYGHVKKILRKLGVKSRAEAVNAATRLRVVSHGPEHRSRTPGR